MNKSSKNDKRKNNGGEPTAPTVPNPPVPNRARTEMNAENYRINDAEKHEKSQNNS